MEDGLPSSRHFRLGSRGGQGAFVGLWGRMFRECKLGP